MIWGARQEQKREDSQDDNPVVLDLSVDELLNRHRDVFLFFASSGELTLAGSVRLYCDGRGSGGVCTCNQAR